MQKGTLVWIILLCIAFLMSVFMGASYVFVSKKVKRKRKNLWHGVHVTEKVILISERFEFKMSYYPILILLFAAWIDSISVIFSSQIDFPGAITALAILFASLFVHAVIGIMCFVICFTSSVVKFKTLKQFLQK